MKKLTSQDRETTEITRCYNCKKVIRVSVDDCPPFCEKCNQEFEYKDTQF